MLDGQDYLCDWFNRSTLNPYFATVSSFDKSVVIEKNEDFDYLECAKALAKAYKNNSVKDFDVALIKYATDVMHGDAKEQNYYYTDNLTQSFNCEGNVNVEYIGSGKFKLTPKTGKIVYNEKDYTVLGGDQYWITDIGAPIKAWSGNVIGGSRVTFENGSVILNMAGHKETIMKGNNWKVTEDGVKRYLAEGFDVGFICGKTTYHSVCTPK